MREYDLNYLIGFLTFTASYYKNRYILNLKEYQLGIIDHLKDTIGLVDYDIINPRNTIQRPHKIHINDTSMHEFCDENGVDFGDPISYYLYTNIRPFIHGCIEGGSSFTQMKGRNNRPRIILSSKDHELIYRIAHHLHHTIESKISWFGKVKDILRIQWTGADCVLIHDYLYTERPPFLLDGVRDKFESILGSDSETRVRPVPDVEHYSPYETIRHNLIDILGSEYCDGQESQN